MTKKEEIELILKSKEDISHFKPLYEKYYDKIVRFVYLKVYNMEVAEELTADAFRNAIRAIDSFQDQGYGFSAWIYKIAYNRVLNYYRETSRKKEVDFKKMEFSFTSTDNVEDELERKEEADAQKEVMRDVLSLISKLPEDEQLIISLKFFEKKKSAEIAEIVGIESGNVRVKLHRSLKKLKELYEAEHQQKV